MITAEQRQVGYAELCQLAQAEPVQQQLHLTCFATKEEMALRSLDERLAASVQVLLDSVGDEADQVEQVDRVLLDYYIAKLDEALSKQLDAILHQPVLQQCEASWRGLKYLIDHCDFHKNIKVELLDVARDSLSDDFAEAVDVMHSGLYKHIYIDEYDTPGGEPVSAVIANYEFNSGADDIKLMRNISKVAAAAHCPFIAAASAEFFHKESLAEVSAINDLTNYMERAEYIKWNSFREEDDARYLGLTLPRFILRLPYGEQNPVREFNYQEQVAATTAKYYLWGNAAFAFAANMARSFANYGWTLNIRGPESGGKVANLPLHQYDLGRGLETKIPSETLIPETRELEFANLGFIPLSYYKNSDFACFFSANSIQKPQLYDDYAATTNSRINARLPYVFLSARIGHYLKVLQRENIGANKTRLELEAELNRWLQTLVTKMNKPGPELAATHPLRDGQVVVSENPDNPGFYRIAMSIVPHFQIEGADVRLTLVGQLPRANVPTLEN